MQTLAVLVVRACHYSTQKTVDDISGLAASEGNSVYSFPSKQIIGIQSLSSTLKSQYGSLLI